MRVRVLGPIDIVDDLGQVVSLSARKERVLLATLVCRANRIVDVDLLVDVLWPEHPPRTARKTLQTYVLHLRRHLGDRLEHHPDGYRLRLAPEEIDASTFEQAVSSARLQLLRGDAEAAASQLHDALSAWRGDAYNGVSDHGLVAVEAIRLHELRASAVEDEIDARLTAGDHRAAAAELESLVIAEPLRERLWTLLMRARFLDGRQADALRVFQQAREVLIEEVGLEPGPELRAMEAAVLDGDVERGAARVTTPSTQYATTADGLRIGYWTRGIGPDEVVLCAEWTFNLDLLLELDEIRPFIDELCRTRRLTVIQRRGTGVSDREPAGLSDPRECVADIEAVLDAVGCRGAAFVGWGHGGQVALAFAAAHPERVSRLAIINGYARLSASPEHPDGHPPTVIDAFLGFLGEVWGRPFPKVGILAPEMADDPKHIARYSRLERLTATPEEAVEIQRRALDFDVSDLLPEVRCPTLVVGLEHSVTLPANAAALARLLPDARLVILAGHFIPTRDETTALTSAVVDFLATTPEVGDDPARAAAR